MRSWIVLLGLFVDVAASNADMFGNKDYVGGVEVACHDFQGRNVRLVKVTQMGDVGRASIIDKISVIMLDTGFMAPLPAKLQLFFYWHECAHHMLGHIYKPSPENEKEADCWAIKDGRDHGLFDREDINSFAPFFAASRGSPRGHLPGPERVVFLKECFNQP